MLDDGNTQNMMETPDAPPPEEKSNRTFWIVGGVMAGLVFLTLVCMVIYFLVISTANHHTKQCRAGSDKYRKCSEYPKSDIDSPGSSVDSNHSADPLSLTNQDQSSKHAGTAAPHRSLPFR